MKNILFNILCVSITFALTSHAIKCYVGYSDGINSPVQYETDCGKGVKFCGYIYDTVGQTYNANCDVTNFCNTTGTFNMTYYTVTCCNTDDCNKLK